MTSGIQTRMGYRIRYMNASETQWVACGKCRWSPTGEKEAIEEEGSCPQIGVKRGRGTRWIGYEDGAGSVPSSKCVLDKEGLAMDMYCG